MSKERDHIERLTPDLIRRYQAGELSTGEQHAVEKYLLENPFEAEALDGLEMISSEEADSHIEALHHRIDQKINPSEIDRGATEFWVYTRRIAAAILLLLVVGVAYVWLRPALQQTPMSKELTVNNEDNKSALDSTNASNIKLEEEPVEEKVEDKLVESISPQAEAEAAPVQIIEIEADEDVKEDLEFDEAFTTEVSEPQAESLLNTDQGWLDKDSVINRKEAQQYQARLRAAEEKANEQRARMEAERKSLRIAGIQSKAPPLSAVKSEALAGRTEGIQLDTFNLAQKVTQVQLLKPSLLNNNASPESNLLNSFNSIEENDQLEGYSISGIVKEGSTGKPLSYVQVTIKGATLGQITDTNGRFSFYADTVGVALVASFIGYKSVELPLNGKSTDLEIILEESVGSLNETVVVSDAERSKRKFLNATKSQTSFEDYVSNNLIYPTLARQADIKGRVVLDVEISQEGKATVLNVVRGLGYGCDEEATRLVEAWTGWEAKVDKKTGKTITSSKRVKVRFKP